MLKKLAKKIGWVYGQVANLKYTSALGFSTYGNETFVDSFQQGIDGNGTDNFVMFECNKWGKEDTCDFNTTSIRRSLAAQWFEKEPVNIFGKAKDDKCATCDHYTWKCETCECGSGDTCVPADECTDKCKPTGPKYKCDWTAKSPVCKQDDEGKMDKESCAEECHPAKYGKCDYKNDQCLPCTPGADDPECMYLMDYCNTAQKEGRCKEETLHGLFRMIEVNHNSTNAEFDIDFRGSKMFI